MGRGACNGGREAQLGMQKTTECGEADACRCFAIVLHFVTVDAVVALCDVSLLFYVRLFELQNSTMQKNNTLDGSVRGEINKYQTCVFHIVGVSKVSEALACISNIK